MTKKKQNEVRREENPVVCILKFYQFLELHLKLWTGARRRVGSSQPFSDQALAANDLGQLL